MESGAGELRKKLLGAGLTFLTVALWVGPIVTALGSNNWNLEETFMPSEGQMNRVGDKVENLMGTGRLSSKDFTVTEFSPTDHEFNTTLSFDSPFGFALTVNQFSVTITEPGYENLGYMSLKENTKFEPGGENDLLLSGHLTEIGKERIENIHGGDLPSNIGFSAGTLGFEASGVKVEIQLEDTENGGTGGSSS